MSAAPEAIEPEEDAPIFEDTDFPEPPSDDIGLSDAVLPASAAEFVNFAPASHGELTFSSIPADLLQHFADAKLDDAYDEALRLCGDDLLPIKTAGQLADSLSPHKRRANIGAHSAGGGTAAMPAVDLSDIMPKDLGEEGPVELPVLGADPTAEELAAFANALPSVRLIKHVFRAEVVEVRRHGS